MGASYVETLVAQALLNITLMSLAAIVVSAGCGVIVYFFSVSLERELTSEYEKNRFDL